MTTEILSLSQAAEFLQVSEDVLRAANAAVRLYAESHPRPSHVTQQQATVMLGCGLSKVRSMVRAGTLKLNACGMIPISEIDNALAVRRK